MPESQSTVEYRPIPGHDGYLIGSDGTAWTTKGHLNLRPLATPRPLRLRPDRKGYMCVTLVNNRRHFCLPIHRTVLEVFVGPRPDGMWACHNNGQKTDNRLDNLRWDTPSGNTSDMFIHGTAPIGERQGASKLTTAQVSDIISRLRNGDRQRDLAEEYSVSRALICRISRNSAWNKVAGLARTAEDYRKRGSRSEFAKLVEDDVVDIRRRYDSGETLRQIHCRYPHVSLCTIRSAAMRMTWRHIR
jgi:uncharacterized protein (DUF433 family)